jgi:hypothetical protein
MIKCKELKERLPLGEDNLCNLRRGEHNALLTELALPLITNCSQIVEHSYSAERTLINSHADDLSLLNLTFPDTDAIGDSAAGHQNAHGIFKERLPHLLGHSTSVGDVATEGESVGLHLVCLN